MELLIGCGRRRNKVWGGADWRRLVTLDLDPNVGPDVVWDLNRLPLPFEADTFDEIHCVDVLEHTGRQGDWRFFFAQFDDFYRVLKAGGTFNCVAPRRDSPWAWGDPGHTRIIVPEQLTYLDRTAYAQVGRTPMTDYRPYFEGDFTATRAEKSEHHFVFQITAIKPARTA